MRRTVAIGLIIAGALLLMGSAMALSLNQRSETSRPEGEITAVVIENENGAVAIRTGDRAEVKRTERWNFVRPDYREEIRDGTLRIRTDCTDMLVFNNCGVDLSLVVPEDVEIATRSTNGDVDVTGLESGSVSIATTNGDIDVHDTAAEHVAVTSTNGDLTFDDVSSGSLRAATTNGDIEIGLEREPVSVTLNSTNGDIEAELPAGSYDIRTSTTNGDVTVEDGLEDDDAADSGVTVATTNGDIELRTS